MKKIIKYLLWIMLTIGIVIVIGPMIIGPVLVKSKNWVAAKADVRVVDPDKIDPLLKVLIDNTKGEFESLGFRFLGYMTVMDLAPDLTSYIGLFNNEQEKIIGTTVVITSTNELMLWYHEFTSRYAGGYTVNVSDSLILGVYANPDNITYRYPDAASPRSLYEMHRWIVSRDNRAKNPVGLSPADATNQIGKALDKETQVQVASGYYYLDANEKRFKLTWKGAVIMANKMLFPWGEIREYMDQRASNDAIEGMPRSAVPPYHGPKSPGGSKLRENITPAKQGIHE